MGLRHCRRRWLRVWKGQKTHPSHPFHVLDFPPTQRAQFVFKCARSCILCVWERNTQRDRETKHERKYSIEPVGMEGIVERGVKEVDYLAEEHSSMCIAWRYFSPEVNTSTRSLQGLPTLLPTIRYLSRSLSQLVNVSLEFSSALQDEIMPALKHIRSEIVLAQWWSLCYIIVDKILLRQACGRDLGTGKGCWLCCHWASCKTNLAHLCPATLPTVWTLKT